MEAGEEGRIEVRKEEHKRNNKRGGGGGEIERG